MAKEKAVGFTRKDAERILDTLSRVEGTPSSVIPPVDRSRAFNETPSLPFRNISGETIPAFGCFRIALSTNYGGLNRPLIKAVKPKTNLQGYDIGVNGSNPCEDGKIGQMQTTYTVKVRYDRPPNNQDTPDKLYPYVGLAVGATDQFSVNLFGHDFICRGVGGDYVEGTELYKYIMATPIPKTEPFQVQLQCNNDTDETRGTATERASLRYNVRYLRNDSPQVDARIPIIRADYDPENRGCIWQRPLLGRVRPATLGVAVWRPYNVTAVGSEPRNLDLVYCNEVSEFTTC
tara:strand:- start:3302 stop:4171 length:870 start_codon:yes stop_codon:yes gene_type:complete